MADRDARALADVLAGRRNDPNCAISPGSVALRRTLGCSGVRHLALSSLLSQTPYRCLVP